MVVHAVSTCESELDLTDEQGEEWDLPADWAHSDRAAQLVAASEG